MAWHAITDAVVELRPFRVADRPSLIAGRDDDALRWLGAGSKEPAPTACIGVNGSLVGWIDADADRPWLAGDEVNVGYCVFRAFRGRGLAFRALQLFMHHLALHTDVRAATVLVDADNDRSVRLAVRAGFAPMPPRPAQPAGQRFYARAVPSPPSAGPVTLRALDPADLEADLDAKDEEQMRWMWLPWHVDNWRSMSEPQRRSHALAGLAAAAREFGNGPKWRFAGDADGVSCVVYVDCDLANDKVPAGQANISYSTHPAYRRRGYATFAVRAALQFLGENTGADVALLLVDERNAASLGVARAVRARATGHVVDEQGNMLVRHVIDLRGDVASGG